MLQYSITYRTTQTQNKLTQTCLPPVGFEPTISVLERAKTVHGLDLAVTVIGSQFIISDMKSNGSEECKGIDRD
jgi:hypothetical protein